MARELEQIRFRCTYTNGERWILRDFNLKETMNGNPFEVLSDNPLLREFSMSEQMEVCEGDIIKSPSGKRFEIVWLGTSFFAKTLDTSTGFHEPLTKSFLQNKEIIGNIYIK